MELLIVAAQSAAIYLFLLIGLSRLSWINLSRMTPSGYLMVALLGSSVETGLYHGSASLLAGMVSAAALAATDWVADRTMIRWPRLRRWLVGRPVVLVHDGRVASANLRHVRMTESRLRAMLRAKGHEDLESVRLAVLETNGDVGVIARDRRNGTRSRDQEVTR